MPLGGKAPKAQAFDPACTRLQHNYKISCGTIVSPHVLQLWGNQGPPISQAGQQNKLDVFAATGTTASGPLPVA